MTIARTISLQAGNHPVDSLPEDIRSIFASPELEAYEQGAAYFKSLAEKSASADIQRLLQKLDDNHPMFVDAKKQDDDPWIVWFGFTIVGGGYHPRIRVPRADFTIPQTAPSVVQTLYNAFGGFSDDSFVGGFMIPERIQQGAPEFVMDQHECQKVADSYFFFDYGNGDYAGWTTDGEGLMYNHETGEFSTCPFGDLYPTLFGGFERDPFGGAFG